jgi:hypothetical protein
VVTLLFADVKGSTRRWETDADAMREALAAHDEVLRTAIEAHRGWLFKHTVDGDSRRYPPLAVSPPRCLPGDLPTSATELASNMRKQ